MNPLKRPFLVVVLSLITGIASSNAASLKEKTVKLVAGGPAVRVTATGQDARTLARFSVFRGRKGVSTITAIRRVNVGSNAIIELRATANAVPATGYRLEGRTSKGQRILNARLSVVSKISTIQPKLGKVPSSKNTRTNQVKTARAPVAPTQSAAPTVTSWRPEEKAHPGMVLVVNGQNLNQGDVTLKLGSGSKTVGLHITRRTASRLEARIPDTAYTGLRGAPLAVARRGSQSRVLDADYKVLNKDAVFSGDSLWRARLQGLTSSINDPIVTKGKVNVRLNQFDFANNGNGTYSEATPLTKVVRSRTVKCKGDGKKVISELDFRTARTNRRITWRRLADGRIELTNIGLSHAGGRPSFTVTGNADDRSLTLNYPTFGGTRKRTLTGRCSKTDFSFPIPPPVPKPIPVGSVLSEWVLARKDAR